MDIGLNFYKNIYFANYPYNYCKYNDVFDVLVNKPLQPTLSDEAANIKKRREYEKAS